MLAADCLSLSGHGWAGQHNLGESEHWQIGDGQRTKVRGRWNEGVFRLRCILRFYIFVRKFLIFEVLNIDYL